MAAQLKPTPGGEGVLASDQRQQDVDALVDRCRRQSEHERKKVELGRAQEIGRHIISRELEKLAAEAKKQGATGWLATLAAEAKELARALRNREIDLYIWPDEAEEVHHVS